MPKVINQHSFIILQAWADSYVNFPSYLVRAPLNKMNENFWSYRLHKLRTPKVLRTDAQIDGHTE